MPARRIPLIWKTQKESDQKYLRFDPSAQRVVQIGCCECKTPPPSPFSITGFNLIGGETPGLQVSWTPSSNAVKYTLNFLLSETYPISSSDVLVSYPNVNSGDVVSFVQDINCKYFGVQVIAINDCNELTYSNIADGALYYPTIYAPVPPETASLTFDAINMTISFPNGYNVYSYRVFLYDVTANDYALTTYIIDSTTNDSPYVIPYTALIPFAVTTPPLITGHQYKLIISVFNSEFLLCFKDNDYPPVTFTQTFPPS